MVKERNMNEIETLRAKLIPGYTPVWQLWIGSETPPQLACEKTVETVYNAARGYQYMKLHWIDLPKFLRDLRARKRHKAQDSDVIRLWLLKTFGGVWLDSDIIARKDMEWRKLFEERPHQVFAGCHATKVRWASNGVLGTALPENPVIVETYRLAMELFQTQTGKLGYTDAGPTLLTHVLQQHPDAWTTLHCRDYGHPLTSNEFQKRYQRQYQAPRDRETVYSSKDWYYAHVLGICLKKHQNADLSTKDSIFCELLRATSHELGLQL